MTDHARQQIRSAVVTAVTGLATTGTKVYASRMRPATDSMLPCLLVTTDREAVDSTVQSRQMRELTVTVRGIANGTTNLDATLDTMAKEVETALQSAGTLSGKVPGGLLLQEVDIEFDDALEKPVGVVVLQFKAGYFTQAGAPGVFV